MSTPAAVAAPAVEVQRSREVLATAGLLGLAFPLLFWEAAPGVSFPLYVVLVLAAIWLTARRQGLAGVASSVALTAAAALLATGVAVRAEPLTTAANVLAVLGLLIVLVHAFGDDRWLHYGLRDWLMTALRLSGHEVTGAPRLVIDVQRSRSSQLAGGGLVRALPVLRGALIALPVVAVLALLLASADAVFASRLAELTVSLPQVDDAAAQLVLALAAAYVAAGALWHLLTRTHDPILADRAVPRVLGFTEAAVVLVSVNTLFAGFVVIQLRYFFGGPATVVTDGLTYAEYARRGFGELVAVAAVSLTLHLVLAGLTRRETTVHRWVFTALTSVLTGLVLVILASAFQRLLAYEQAFGFTRSRTAAHVFMVWLAVLLVVLAGLELAGRVRLFLLAGLIAVVGFAATLNAVNVDALIVRHNLARAAAGAELDVAYLQRLSPDAVPALAAALPTLPRPLAAEVTSLLDCLAGRAVGGDWRSQRLADVRARAAWPADAAPAPGQRASSPAGPCPRS